MGSRFLSFLGLDRKKKKYEKNLEELESNVMTLTRILKTQSKRYAAKGLFTRSIANAAAMNKRMRWVNLQTRSQNIRGLTFEQQIQLQNLWIKINTLKALISELDLYQRKLINQRRLEAKIAAAEANKLPSVPRHRPGDPRP